MFRAPRRDSAAVVGYPTFAPADPNRPSIEVLAEILAGEGGTAGERALATSARPPVGPARASRRRPPAGYLAIGVTCPPARLDAGVAAVRAALGAGGRGRASTPDEVTRATRRLVGARAAALRTRMAVADALVRDEGLGARPCSAYRRYLGGARPRHRRRRRARRAGGVLDPQREIVAVVQPAERGPRARAHSSGGALTMASCGGCAAEVQLEDTFCPRCGAPVTDPFIGVVVGERYRIVSRIGVGGMGAVYRAEHTMMRRDLAIKVLLPELGGKEEFARRFEREAESASRLTHPNIITVTDFGHTADGSLFLVMEFLAGESLSDADQRRADAAARARSTIMRQMLRGARARARAPASSTATSSPRTSCWSSATASATWSRSSTSASPR